MCVRVWIVLSFSKSEIEPIKDFQENLRVEVRSLAMSRICVEFKGYWGYAAPLSVLGDVGGSVEKFKEAGRLERLFVNCKSFSGLSGDFQTILFDSKNF